MFSPNIIWNPFFKLELKYSNFFEKHKYTDLQVLFIMFFLRLKKNEVNMS